jgi:hypothetical protein
MVGKPDHTVPVNRRTALKSAAGGVSAITATSMIGMGSISKDMVEIVVETGKINNNEVEITKPVPKSWYQYEQKVDRTKGALKDELPDDSAIAGVSLVTNKNGLTKSGKKTTQLKVTAKDENEELAQKALDKVPDSKNGIPITTAVEPPITSANTSHEPCFHEVNDMKGGIAIRGDDDNDGNPDGWFSAACRVSKDDEHISNDYILTCNHGFFDDVCSDNSGKELFYSDGSKYGEIYEYNEKWDWAIIEPCCESNINPEIIHSRWDHPVSTNKTRNGLKDMMSNDTAVERVGAASGEIQGTIQEIDYDVSIYPCLQYPDGVKTNTGGVFGDSGGPIYTESCCYDMLSKVSIHTTSHGDDIFQDCWDRWVDYYDVGSPCWKMNDFDILFHG